MAESDIFCGAEVPMKILCRRITACLKSLSVPAQNTGKKQI